MYIDPSESVWERRFNGHQKKMKYIYSIIVVKLVQFFAIGLESEDLASLFTRRHLPLMVSHGIDLSAIFV